ncbi:MAG: hypothetical protein AAFU79_22675 [Myxococcota bacterium]
MDAHALAVWLTARLASEEARADWEALIRGGWESLLDRPIEQLLAAPVFAGALDDVLTAERLESLARAAVRLGLAPLEEELKTDEEAVGRYLDEGSRARLEAMVTREGLIDETWVDVVFSQGATEELFADTLFRGLADFSEAIPNLLQSTTPAALGKIASRLQGATGGVRDRMREELKSRVEPEIRRFVQKATRRLLDGTASFVKGSLDGEQAGGARKNLLAHALSRPTQNWLRPLDASGRADLEAVLVQLARSEAGRAEARTRLERMHRGMLERFGPRSARAVLAAHDLEVGVEPAVWAEVTWPWVQTVLHGEAAKTFIEKLAAEIIEEVRAGD